MSRDLLAAERRLVRAARARGHRRAQHSQNPDDRVVRSGRPTAIILSMASRPTLPRYQTKMRRRHGLFVSTCSCGWSEKAVSKLSAWMAERRHLDAHRRQEPVEARSA